MAHTKDLTFLFVTDFHGDETKYEWTLQEASNLGVNLIVNGGDLCPHGGDPAFLDTVFADWLKKARHLGITVMGMFGNDDLKINLDPLDHLEAEGLFTRIDNKTVGRVETGGWKFWGYNFVPDYPFGLKDWVKLDHEGDVRPPQFTHPVLSTKNGLEEIRDIEKYFRERSTIEEDLREITLEDPDHTICVIHTPPHGLGLDVCANGKEVGSRSVLKFTEREQPLLTLHGHIHESPQVSGTWQAAIGRTTALQPGQEPIKVTVSHQGVTASYLR